jgi:hypothetical protein
MRFQIKLPPRLAVWALRAAGVEIKDDIVAIHA